MKICRWIGEDHHEVSIDQCRKCLETDSGASECPIGVLLKENKELKKGLDALRKRLDKRQGVRR